MTTSTPSQDGERLRQEYTNEEVSEIIRIALQNTNGTDSAIVNREEMLTIGEEFGLSVVDIVRATEEIEASKEDTRTSSRVLIDFKIHVVCYIAGVIGLFLINVVTNWSSPPTVIWWFLLAAFAYGPVVAVHGYVAKVYPNLITEFFSEESTETTSPPAEASTISR